MNRVDVITEAKFLKKRQNSLNLRKFRTKLRLKKSMKRM